MGGTISIIDSKGAVANTKAYRHNAHLLIIKELWKKLYGKKYSEDVLVITPDQVSVPAEKHQFKKNKGSKGLGSKYGKKRGVIKKDF